MIRRLVKGFLRLEAAGGLFIEWLPTGWGVLHILVLVASYSGECVLLVALGTTRSLFTSLKLTMRECKKSKEQGIIVRMFVLPWNIFMKL